MEKEIYERISKYEYSYWWYKGKRNLLKRILTGKKFTRALDIGCGVGSNLEVLKEISEETIGTDNSDEAIRFCKNKGLKVIKGDAESLPFKNEQFDLVLASDIIEHVDDYKSLKDIKRILTNDGTIILTVPAFNFLWSDKDDLAHHKRRYTKKMVENLLRKNGFKIIKIGHWDMIMFVPLFIFSKVQKLVKKKTAKALRTHPVFDKLLYALIWLENRSFYFPGLPIGVSIVAVARKI